MLFFDASVSVFTAREPGEHPGRLREPFSYVLLSTVANLLSIWSVWERLGLNPKNGCEFLGTVAICKFQTECDCPKDPDPPNKLFEGTNPCFRGFEEVGSIRILGEFFPRFVQKAQQFGHSVDRLTPVAFSSTIQEEKVDLFVV